MPHLRSHLKFQIAISVRAISFLRRCWLLLSFFLLVNQIAPGFPSNGQQKLPLSKYRGREMLKTIESDLRTNYYDPDFHNMDLKSRFKAAQDKLEGAQSNGQVYAIIAQLLSELNDSHTRFLPPSWRLVVDYGFRLQTIGEHCYVTEVSPRSDAAAQGMEVGDRIVSIDSFVPAHDNLWRIMYSYFILQPRDGMKLTLRKIGGQSKILTLKMRILRDEEHERSIRQRQQSQRPQYYEINNEIIICRLPHFNFEEKELSAVVKRIEQFNSIVLDLRGNPGGLQNVLQSFLGYFFERQINIARLKERSGERILISKLHPANIVKGRLIVLVDNGSASSAEIFARTIQLQERGSVIGDQTAGDVMFAGTFMHRFSNLLKDDWYYNVGGYGAEITVADVLMPDGQRLEGRGVMPDRVILPTSVDLTNRRDPVLAKAVELVGGQLDPVVAGSLFKASN